MTADTRTTRSASTRPGGGHIGLGATWLVFAVFLFLLTLGYGWPFSVAAGVVGLLLLVRRPPRPVTIGLSVLVAGFGLYLVTLIPSSTGSEAGTAILALGFITVALLTYGLLSRDVPRR
jgi:hypothetical protein